MTDNRHIVCPHCHTTNRVRINQLGQAPTCGICKQDLFTGHSTALATAGDALNFDKHVNRNQVPVLVDFWAPWCKPCLAMAPGYEQAVARLEPLVRVLKVDTQALPALGGQFNIRSIPTLVLFVDGSEVARQAGVMAAADIVQWVRANTPAAT